MSDVKLSAVLCAEQMEQTPYEERAEAAGSFGVFEQQDLPAGAVEIQSTTIREPQLQEIYTGKKTSSRSAPEVKDMTGMISHLSVDMDQYLEESAVVMRGPQEDLVRDTFEQVIVRHDGKRRPPDIKKPVRKKLRDRQRSGCSSSEGELERVSSQESLDGDVVLNENAPATTAVLDPPASPLVVETPLGSIKDRVRALQDKVEEEAEQKYTPPAKSSMATKRTEADMPELPRVPMSPKSPRSQTERLEETMSVRDLLRAFQTGEDPSKNKTGLFEHKPLAPALVSESGYGDTEQEQTPQTQAHDVQQQLDDLTGGQKGEAEESLSGPERVADGECAGSQAEAPERTEKETLSVKERAKTFQHVREHKPELFDPKLGVGYAEGIEMTERRSSEELDPQPQYLDVSTRHIKAEKSDGGRMPSSAREHSEDSHGVPVERTVRFTDILISDDGSVTTKETLSVKELMKAFQSGQDPPKSRSVEHTVSKEALKTSDAVQFQDESIQRKEPESRGGNLSRMELEDPSLSMARGLPEDIQISPDRRPSEDFSADIKAELEESPEYQLFKQASTASDIQASYHLTREGDSLFDTQTKDDGQSPGSPKQEGLAGPSDFIEKGESEKPEGPIGSRPTATQSLSYSSSRERESLKGTTKEITEVKLQEVHVKRETPARGSSGQKDMSGMLSLMTTDLDQCLKALPVMSSTPEEEVVHETFQEVVIKKSKDKEMAADTTDENAREPVSSAFLESDQSPGEEASNGWRGEEEEPTSYQPTTKVKDSSGMISLLTADLENEVDRPSSVRFPEGDVVQGPRATPAQAPATLDVENTLGEEAPHQADLVEILPGSESDTFQKDHFSHETQRHESREKNMSGMLTLLSSDLDEYLNESPVSLGSPQEDSFVHEVCKEDTKTRVLEDRTAGEEHKQMQAELSASPVSETPFQEERSDTKPPQLQSVVTRDITGMLSLLTSDLDEYVKEHPLPTPDNQAEVVSETYQEVILSKVRPVEETVSPEHEMSLEDIDLDTERRAEHGSPHSVRTQLSSDKPRQPVTLERLNMVPDDPAKEPCLPDSLEASPQVEDRSSRTTPDSIEPGPGGESPCPDSLESSPTTDLQMPARAAVYEDYASQLEACFAYDKDVYRDESEEEQEANVFQTESEIKPDVQLESSKGDTVDIKTCSRESLHILLRQDSEDRDDDEDNDLIDQQLTPEEKLVQTPQEMGQGGKEEDSDNAIPLETGSADHDEAVQGSHLYSGPSVNLVIQEEKIPAELRSVDESLCSSGTHTDELGLQTEEAAELSDSVSKSEQESIILAPEGGKDEAVNVDTGAAGQRNLKGEGRTPLLPPDEKSSNPFQFQEGKLFEMTRGGAIDMTSFEGDECAFFHIGELPVERGTSGPTGEDQQRSDSATSEEDKTACSLNSMSGKPSDSSESHHSLADLGSSTEVHLGSPSCERFAPEYCQSTIADLQPDPSLTVHLLDSMQGQPSPGSSDDEERQGNEEDQRSDRERSSTDVPNVQESSQIKPVSATEQAELEAYEPQRTAEGKSAADRRSRSEADSDAGKTSATESRSYSDGSDPTDKSEFVPPNLSITNPQYPPTAGERDDIHPSKNTDTSARSFDTGDTSSSSHKSPDSVVFTYDILPSRSSDSDYNPLLGVKPSSETEDVFKAPPVQDDMAKTQTQTITDDQTAPYPSGTARLFALPGAFCFLFFFPVAVRLRFVSLRMSFQVYGSHLITFLCTATCPTSSICVCICPFVLTITSVLAFVQSQDWKVLLGKDVEERV